MTNFDEDDLDNKSVDELLRITGAIAEGQRATSYRKIVEAIRKGEKPSKAFEDEIKHLVSEGFSPTFMRRALLDRLLGVYKN